MQNDVVTKILAENKELLSLPHTLAEVMKVTRNEKSSAKDLADVLMRDPALTAKVLRIVNSPFYGIAKGITTMTQAVVTLGTRTVTALTLSSSVYKMTGDWKSSLDRLRFWRHSLEVAIASRMIAETIRYPQAEEAFVAGLLHDIGLLVLDGSFPEQSKTIWKKAAGVENTIDLEDETWGTNHARVGQFLLEQWHVPQRICDAVGHHHAVFPPEATTNEHLLDQIVALANYLSRFRIQSTQPSDPVASMTNRMVLRDNLGLKAEAVLGIEEKLFARTVAESRFLEMEIGSVDDLLMEANQLLFQQYMTVENLLCENRRMQQQIARDQMKKLALESLKTITATFNHYMNNATATILGRAQLIEYGVTQGRISDPDGSIASAMQIIGGGVNTISLVMEELKNLASFDTTAYRAETYIIDIENRIKKRLENLLATTTGAQSRNLVGTIDKN